MSSLAPVASNVESWGISRRTALRTRNGSQIPRLSSVVWFATTPAPFILETIFCADHFRGNYRADDDSRNEPGANVASRNLLCVEGDLQRDDEIFFGVRKDDVTFLGVQIDVSSFLFLVRAQASAQARLLSFLDHVRIR